MYTNNLFRIRL